MNYTNAMNEPQTACIFALLTAFRIGQCSRLGSSFKIFISKILVKLYY